MGCTSSKQRRCRHCRTPYSAALRTYSMHVVHPPQEKGDSCHVVALTSSTLGSLRLTPPSDTKHTANSGQSFSSESDAAAGIAAIDDELKSREFSIALKEAKSWSDMIQEKIPKVLPTTPARTPPAEFSPETINTWELMAGLDEDDANFNSNRIAESPIQSNPNQIKPIWTQLAEEQEQNPNSITSEFNPQIISTFRKSLTQISPDHPFYLKPSSSSDEDDKPPPKPPKDKPIIYFTTLRGVRKTYEDCCNVITILKSLSLKLDERDVSIHSGFKEELKNLLADKFIGGGLGLPRVFVGKRYIGGADEIRRMHEEGKLEAVFRGCERAEGGGGGGGACEACGDVRFVPCETCSGSCKIYCEEEEDDDVDEQNSEYGFQRCPDCNENGLIRCPICCC